MSDRRILIKPNAVEGRRIRVADAATLHHVARVLRMREGEALECLDGEGGRYRGVIEKLGAREMIIAVESQSRECPTAGGLRLVAALIKPARFEWIVEKASELGADALAPVAAERSVIRLSAAQQVEKAARWQRIADQAAAQCGRAARLKVEPVRGLAEWLSVPREGALLIATLVAGTKPLAAALGELKPSSPVSVMIGPEGDFSPAEVDLAKRHGAIPVSLGPLTLRSETAAVAVLAILQHQRAGA